MRKIAWAAGLLSIMAASPVLAAPLPGFVPIAATPRFTFYARGNAKVEAHRTEKFVQHLEALLGQTVSGHADYYRYASAQEVAAGTGTFADGVTFVHGGQGHSPLA